MSISKGDKLPAGQLLKPGANGPEPVDTAELATGRVAIFAVPGAYTPTCSNAASASASTAKTARTWRNTASAKAGCGWPQAVRSTAVASR